MPIVIPELSDIQILCANVVVVSELDQLSSSNIEETDVFTFARNIKNLSTNYNIPKQYFDRQLIDWMLSDDLNISGTWEYSLKKSSKLCIETSSLNGGTWDDRIINKEWFEANVLQAITDLSHYIYVQQHVPSIIGQIVYSMVLSTEQMVKDRYGGEEWERLSNNNIIIGYGKSQANNITKYGNLMDGEMNIAPGEFSGGENKVLLSSENIPRHTHKFVGKTTNFKFHWHYRGSVGEHACQSIVENDDWGEKISPHDAKIGALGGGIKVKGETDIGSSKIYGKNPMPLHRYIYPVNGGQGYVSLDPHNNIPPVLYTYVWRRKR